MSSGPSFDGVIDDVADRPAEVFNIRYSGCPNLESVRCVATVVSVGQPSAVIGPNKTAIDRPSFALQLSSR